jgi:hypothetical protein
MIQKSTAEKAARYCFAVLLLCITNAVSAQSIKGMVTDSLSNPLPGTSVLIKGTTIGTTTDANGGYTLVVPEDLSDNTTIVTIRVTDRFKKVYTQDVEV